MRLTVADEAAGRSGKCPKCGASILVPLATPEPVPSAMAAAMPVAAAAVVPAPADRDVEAPAAWEEDGTESSGPPGRAISYGAIGVAWQLLREQLGTWMLTTFVLYLALAGLGLVLQIVTTAGMIAAVALLGPFGIPMVVVTMAVVNLGVQGLAYGGLFRMALKQVDGGEVAVGDLFALGGENRAERLAKAMILICILGMLGCALLILPGLVFFGLAMFAIPMIVDSRIGAWASLKASLGALRRDWISALLFAVATTALAASGMLLLGLGVLFTVPWSALAVAVQYRRSFAPGAKPRPRIIADPHAEAVGIPEDEREAPRAPVLAWALMGGVVLIPVAVAAMMLTVLAKAWEASMDDRPGRVANRFGPPPSVPRVMTKGAPGPVGGPAAGAPTAPPVALVPAPASVWPRGQGAAEALSGLRGDRSARLDALRWLSGNDPAPGEPLQGEIGKALAALLVAQPGESNLAGQGLVNWATRDDLPAVAAASWYEHPPGVSKLMQRVLQRLRDAEGTAGRKAIDEAVERGRDAARLDAIRIALAEARSDEAGTRLRAVRRLRKMPVEPQFQDEVISTMSELIRDHKSTSRTDAVGTIGVWARPGDEKILIAVLEDREDRLFARPTALEALARSKDPEVIAAIVAVAPDRVVSSQAAQAIRDYGALAEPALLDLIKSDSAPARVTACQFLDDVGTARCLPALREAVRDPDRQVAGIARTAIKAVEQRLGVEPEQARKPQTAEKSPRKKSSRPMRKRTQPNAPKGRNN